MNHLIIYIFPILFFLASCTKEDNEHIIKEKNGFCEKESLKIKDIIFRVDALFKCGSSKTALSIINANADKIDVDEEVAVGAILYDYGFYDDAKKFFISASEKNNAEANYRLGYLYTNIEMNNVLAIKYFEKSAKGGYTESYINLGDIYLFEQDVLNYDLARKYFEKAISLKNYKGFYGLGELSLREGNYNKAKKYFEDLNENGYYFEAYVGFLNLYSGYPQYSEYDLDKAKKYIDLIELIIEDSPQKFSVLYDFYSSDSKFKDEEKAKVFYSKLKGEK